MNAPGQAGEETLRSIAQRVLATHPEAEGFANRAMAEIESLRKRLTFAEHLIADSERAAAAAAAQSDRQSSLVLEQGEELAHVYAQLRRITALCDLAEWSARTADVNTRSAVLVEDLRRALGGTNAH